MKKIQQAGIFGFKIFSLALLALVLAGCNSPKDCNRKGYKGIVIGEVSTSPDIYCSNGTVTPNGKSFVTNEGDMSMGNHVYFIRAEQPQLKE